VRASGLRRRPRRLFSFGDLVIVRAGSVYWRKPGFFGVGDADKSKRRVGCGRLQLALERQQASPDHILLGCVELVGEAFESIALVGDEVHLQRGCFTDAATCHDILS